MLVGIVGLPITEAIIVNLVVVALAALFMVIHQKKMLSTHVPTGKREWILIAIPAFLGVIGGRLLGSRLSPHVLVSILGVYAILVGVRIFFIKPLPGREVKAHESWLAPASLTAGVLEGLISALEVNPLLFLRTTTQWGIIRNEPMHLHPSVWLHRVGQHLLHR
ncbi:MAG TPA: sulfite exporter TauE/SafE family protein [Spirochaetales bacterium]|nr:sulfite exporter TauE/SafE family protein [Spirochaetales bacterium]HQK34998.1 sulfite exporter TauE/SafE family protein [Spirochaetales bacterium]